MKGHDAEVDNRMELLEHNTGDPRKRLGATRAQKRRKVQNNQVQPEASKKKTTARVLRVPLMRPLNPITVLSGPRLQRAVWDIIYCE